MKSRLEFHKAIRLKRIIVLRILIFLAAALFLAFNHWSIAQEKTNQDEFKEEFALGNGPQFELPDQQQKVVDRVIQSVTGGYYGDLVIPSESNGSIHLPAFLSRYLREFSFIEKKNRGPKEYDTRFETILNLASQYPAMLDDPRLDWDIYRSLRLYEISWPGEDSYRDEPRYEGDEPSNHELDSATDLAWMYIDYHADDLMKDGDRLQWWVDHLARRLREDRRGVYRWFLLKLCTLAEQPPAEESYERPVGEPSPLDPFLVVEENSKPPSFQEALYRIVRPLVISFEVWGINPQEMPPALILNRNTTAMHRWPQDRSFIIGQESWSDPEKSTYRWGVRFFSIKYRRAQYSNVSIPNHRKDGVFFFPFNNRIYVWPKAEMDAGVLRMLHVAGLIDDVKLERLLKACGFLKLETTLTGR